MKSLFLLLFSFSFALQSCGSNEAVVSNETTGTIKGTVIDTNGIAVERVVISSTPPSSQLLTASDGSFTLPDLAPGVYTVLAEKTNVGSGQASVNVVAGKTTSATIILTPGPITTGVISGTVVDSANNPIADAAIGTLPTSKTTTTDATGHFTMAGIQPGTYSVVAQKDGFDNGSKNATVLAGLTASVTIKLGVAGALPTDGLLAYYKFDGDGTDASGNDRPLFVANASFVASRSGTNQAISINSGSSVTASDDPALNPAAITISFWMKTLRPSVSDGTGVTIINKYAGSATFNGYTVWFNGPGQIAWTYGADPSNLTFCYINSNTVVDNQWHSVICTADNTGCKLYFNGAVAASAGWTGTPGKPNHNVGLRIGDENGNFTGAIDDVRIYNRVLSAKEIQDLATEK